MKRDFPEALYNAGLAYQRCNKDAEAKAQFQAALDLDPKFHRARVQLALYDLKEKGDSAIEPVIGRVGSGRQRRAVSERRGARQPGDASDEAARDQLGSRRRQRLRSRQEEPAARARDRRRVPAGVQSARALLPRDREAEGRWRRAHGRKTATFTKTRRADQQQLELAALVCSQAIRKNPNYAGHPQHRRAHPGRAAEHQQRGPRVPDGGEARSDVLRSADELRGREPLVPRVQGSEDAYRSRAQDSSERLRRAPRARARDSRADRRLELRQARR